MDAFRTRNLSHLAFAYLLGDATYVKARVGGRVVSRAVVVSRPGLNEDSWVGQDLSSGQTDSGIALSR